MYCIDTGVLIQANQQLAPMDINTSFWTKFEELVSSGRAIAPDDVLREIEKKDDEVHKWCKTLNGMYESFFVLLEEDVQEAASEVLAKFPKLVDDRQGKGQADPFVIALTRIRGATVVTQEVRTGSNNRPKIPDVCAHYRIGCIALVELMRAEGWKF